MQRGASRDDHNEIERKRRDVQRQKLEELRQVIPALNMERASMVTILVRAKEYIEQLRGRIMELENGGAMGRANERMMIHPLSATPRPTVLPRPAASAPLPRPPPPAISLHALTEAHQQAFAQQAMNLQQAPMMDMMGFAHLTPADSPMNSPLNSKVTSPLRQSLKDEGQKERRLGLKIQPVTLSDEERFDPMIMRPVMRRESSLIMPIGKDDRVLFGRRESGLNSFLSAPLPDVLQELCQMEIHCGKCAEGINNLVMLDCDCCHGWYHLRCIGMEFESIPSSWICGECRLKAQ